VLLSIACTQLRAMGQYQWAVPEAYREADRLAQRLHAVLVLHDLIQVGGRAGWRQ
jgi:hypothetical protein